MRLGFIFGISLLAALLQAPAFAEDDVKEEPQPKSLSQGCGAQCANFVPAKPLKHEIPEFPRREYMGFYATNSEGYVWLRYTVGVDGKTHDISKIYELGKPGFAERAVETVKDWTFEPALLDGKPVPESKLFSTVFKLGNASPPRQVVLDAFKEANALYDGGKLDEASSVLQEALADLRLSLLERCMLSLPAAKIALRRKDYLEARRHALIVSLPSNNLVPDYLRLAFLQNLISADLMLGEFVDAFNAYYWLQRAPGFQTSSPYVTLINQANAEFQKLPQLVAQARIPLKGTEGVAYFHILNRKTFYFAAIEGALERYVLECKESVTEAKITPTAQWRVPAKWNNCRVYVYGTPGTTFRFVEINEEKQ